jgi:hypothetical protein
MKKVIVILSVFMLAVAGKVSAQIGTTATQTSKITLEECLISGVTLREGINRVPVPNGRGTIQITKTGDRFSDAVYTDAAGKATRLAPNNSSTENLPKTPCKNKLPDACFGSASLNAVMCLCRPTNLSAAGSGDPTEILIGLLLPAVQKIREAGGRP